MKNTILLLKDIPTKDRPRTRPPHNVILSEIAPGMKRFFSGKDTVATEWLWDGAGALLNVGAISSTGSFAPRLRFPLSFLHSG